MVRLEDLGPAARARAEALLEGESRVATRDSRRRAKSPGLPLTCVACGVVIHPVTEGRLARHQAETGHGRFEWVPDT